MQSIYPSVIPTKTIRSTPALPANEQVTLMSRGVSTTVLEETNSHPHGLSAHPTNNAMEMELDPPSTKKHPPSNLVNTASQSMQSSQMPPPPLPSQIPSQPPPFPGSQPTAPPYTFTPLLTSQRTIVPQRPHPTDDLLSLFNLDPLVSSVTRINPITGVKENKLRRSYENQLKPFDLCGRNKAVKHEENTPGGLLEMTLWPEDDWENTQVRGKETSKGLSASTQARLEAAMRMEPGVVPRDQEWQNILGLDRAKEAVVNPLAIPGLTQDQLKLQGKRKHGELGVTAGQPPAKHAKVNGVFKGNSTPVVNTPPANEVARPKRVAKKRRYDEDSYAGYGEGYVDDEIDADVRDRGGGYDSDEGSRLSRDSKKRRKKDRDYSGGGVGGGGPSTPGLVQRAGSYGVGMIGVGSGYGR